MRREDWLTWALAIIAILVLAIFIYQYANSIDLP